jgi:hypothetical protein
MSRMSLAIVTVAALALPALALAETWDGVPMVDKMCSGKVKGDPDKHTTSCALKCAGSGYGVLKADGTFVPFDKAGNEKALAALKATKKADHLRVNVTGEVKEGAIAVATLTLAD